MAKSTVHIDWTIAGHGTTTSSGGVVCCKDKEGLYILSTFNQLKPFADNYDYNTLIFKEYEISITVFDRVSVYTGVLYRLNTFADLTLTRVKLSNVQLLEPPMPEIHAALFSNDPLYPMQSAYAVHHPAARRNDESEDFLYFQQTTGHIVDLEYYVPEQPSRVHYDIDLVMSGSTGGPIFDKKSHKVLGLICGHMPGTTYDGRSVIRSYAISLATIRKFLEGTPVSV